MIRLIIKFCLICTFLYVPSLTKAQTSVDLFSVADKLYAAGELQWAKIEYEKVIYTLSLADSSFSADSLLLMRSKALLKKTYCYKAQGKFSDAQKNIERAELNNLPDAILFQILYETALCAYLAQNYTEAYNYILQLKYLVKDTSFTQQVDFLEILTLNELLRWEEAKNLCKAYIEKYQINANAEEVYYFLKNPKIRNANKAAMLSTFMPGVGQIYAGYPFRGITSSVLQLAGLSFGAYSIWQGYYLSGFFTGLAMFQTFYTGGIRHSRYLAEKKNKERVARYNNHIKEFILKEEADRLK